jgi:hypothetical protein
MPFPEPIKSALEATGISASGLDRIRLARGVVGKTSYVAGAAILALAAIGVVLREPTFLLAIGGIIAAVFVVYFAGVIWFAHHHPGESLLEGAELIQWRQMEMAAKDLSLPPPEPQREIGSSEGPK